MVQLATRARRREELPISVWSFCLARLRNDAFDRHFQSNLQVIFPGSHYYNHYTVKEHALELRAELPEVGPRQRGSYRAERGHGTPPGGPCWSFIQPGYGKGQPFAQVPEVDFQSG